MAKSSFNNRQKNISRVLRDRRDTQKFKLKTIRNKSGKS